MLKKPKFWDQKKNSWISFVLLPLSIVTYLNNFISKFYSKKVFKIKTICVGNIYVGGTGKTPLAIELFKISNNLNLKTVIIKKKYLSHQDEINLLKTKVNLITNFSRSKALKIAEKKKYDVAIFDDGLQDKHIKYDLKIVCFDKKNFLGNEKLIPAGPLRQSIESIKDCNYVFFNGPYPLNLRFKQKIKKLSKKIIIFESLPKLINSNENIKKKRYLLFSGIGNPKNFLFFLKKKNYNILNYITFPDHYDYSMKDLNKLRSIAKNSKTKLLTTEKDYLRIKFYKKDISYVKIQLDIKNKNKLIKNLKKII